MANNMPLTTNIDRSRENEQAMGDWRVSFEAETEGLKAEKRNVSRGWIQPPTAAK